MKTTQANIQHTQLNLINHFDRPQHARERQSNNETYRLKCVSTTRENSLIDLLCVDIIAITTETCVFISYHRCYHHRKHSIYVISRLDIFGCVRIFVVIFVCLSMAGCQHVWERFSVCLTRSRRDRITDVPIFTEDDDGICQYIEILICAQSCVTQTIAHVERFDRVVCEEKGQLTQFLRAHSWDEWERWKQLILLFMLTTFFDIRFCVYKLSDMYVQWRLGKRRQAN